MFCSLSTTSCRRFTKWDGLRVGLCLGLGAVLFASSAQARRTGVTTFDCSGCHNGDREPTLSLSAEPELPQPGDTVLLTLSVSASGMNDFGFFMDVDEFGGLQNADGQPTREDEFGITHARPISAEGGAGSVQIRWQVPDHPGGVVIGVAAVAANGDGRSTGDGAGQASFNFVWGCDAVPIFRDSDGDGAGSIAYGEKLGCADTSGWTTVGGDCNDNNDQIHPAADEVCNGKDDDCDGDIDEDADPRDVYLDEDGDGFGTSSVSQIACALPAGFADNADDCVDVESSIHPDAEETCNGLDDDCDGDIDEGAKPRCGVGWCERYAVGCDPNNCLPGTPIPETCNGFDDDCDGVVDNGQLCAEGEECLGSTCKTQAEIAALLAPPTAVDPGEPDPNQSAPESDASSDDASSVAPNGEGDDSRVSVVDATDDESSCSSSAPSRGAGSWVAIFALVTTCSWRRRTRQPNAQARRNSSTSVSPRT